jgi:flavodoxin
LGRRSERRQSEVKALVVYDSVFGNTGQIAEAIGDALGSFGDVEALQVGDVRAEQLAGVDLLVVGSPTRQFSPTGAITELLKGIPGAGLADVKVAAFDTRFTVEEIEKVRILAFFVRIFGYAAEPIAKRLVKKGGELATDPEGFYVDGTEGPLREGELQRAARWAGEMARSMS